MNEQNPRPEPYEIVFHYANSPHGWMHLHSVYGCQYMGVQWKSAAEAWYTIVHDVTTDEFRKHRYKTAGTTMSDQEKWNHLLGITKGKVEAHPIIKEFLLDLGNQDIIYNVSKYASHDQKWLGLSETDQIGENKLGEAWMTIREQLQSQHQ